MTTLEHEQIALIKFIGQCMPGSILQQIAQRRFHDLSGPDGKYQLPEPRIPRNFVKCFNIITGEEFPSITSAARAYRIPQSTLTKDIQFKKFQYPIRRCA